jgi:hypothetical protein
MSKQRRSKRGSATSKKETARSKRAAKAKSATKSTRKTAAQKKKATTSASLKKRSGVSSDREIQQEIRNRNRAAAARAAGRESGDLQGVSREEQADSESVDELVEEGNAFEAGAVAGVEEADSEDEREVHTHEVPEDDVPEEYLDKD